MKSIIMKSVVYNLVLDQLTSIQNIGNVVVYIVIALVMLLGISKCIFPVWHNAAALKRGVRKMESKNANKNRPIWQEPRFLGRSLQLHWQKFLLNAQHLDLRGIPCNTVDYINESSVIYIPGHEQFAELIPSLLTSLGILGTFMGLMQGLAGLDVSDASKTMESIPVLLGGMRYAFTTSIVGISCSLTFNIVNRITVGHAYQAMDDFDEAFYELAMARPLDPTVQLMCQNQDSTSILRTATEDISATMVNSVELAISRALQPVALSMDNFIAGATHEQINGVQNIVNQFLNQMNRSLNGQFNMLANTIDAINKSQKLSFEHVSHTIESTDSLAKNIEHVQGATNNIIKQLENYIDVIAKDRKQSTSYNKAFYETLQSLELSLVKQDEYRAALAEYQNKLHEDYRQYISWSEKVLQLASEQNSNSTKEIKTIADKMKSSTESMVNDYGKAVKDINSGMNETMKSFAKNMEKLLTAIEKHTA